MSWKEKSPPGRTGVVSHACDSAGWTAIKQTVRYRHYPGKKNHSVHLMSARLALGQL